MGLKQVKAIDRIVFLQKFTEELIINIAPEQQIKKKIMAEKIKQKFIEPAHPTSKNIPQNSSFKKPVETKESLIHKAPVQKISYNQVRRIPILKQPLQKHPPRRIIKPISKEMQSLTRTKPEHNPSPQGFYLGKLEGLLRDPVILSIECPGPGKNVLIKRNNKIQVTKITLNQEEITNIIDNFAKESKIPLIKGILKAAVGNMIISAVNSEFVGSRFIINRTTPYSLIS